MADSESSTTLPGLSRRDFLSTLTAMAGSAALPEAKAGRALDDKEVDPAVPAWKAWRTVSRKALALCRKQQRLEGELARTIGFPQVAVNPGPVGAAYSIPSLEAFDRLAASTPALLPFREGVETQLRDHQARWDDADRRLGFSATQHDEQVALAEEEELAEQLFATEAWTIPGIIGKLEALIHLDAPSEDTDERPWPQLRRIRQELTGMIGPSDVPPACMAKNAGGRTPAQTSPMRGRSGMK